jgi:hypothetical protein
VSVKETIHANKEKKNFQKKKFEKLKNFAFFLFVVSNFSPNRVVRVEKAWEGAGCNMVALTTESTLMLLLLLLLMHLSIGSRRDNKVHCSQR